MPLAKQQANAKRKVVKVAREAVLDIAAIGGMWFVRTADRLYVTHCSWYSQFSAADLVTMRELLLAGWTKEELGARYDVHPSAISQLFEGDREVSMSKSVRFRQRKMKTRTGFVGKGLVFG